MADLLQRVGLPPPPASPVPLPRKRERLGCGTIAPHGLLSRLRGRGTTQSVVEGGATRTVASISASSEY
jgi:hypothetical protein